MRKRPDRIPHHRLVLAGIPQYGLRETLLEQRGIFTSVVNIYDNPAITQAELEFNHRTPREELEILREAAEKVLLTAGEASYIDTLMKVDDSKNSKATTAALQLWHDDIVARKGASSCEGIAANFLFTMDQVGVTDEPEARWDAVIVFALALHKFALDHSGNHELIVSGLEKSDNLLSGSQTRARKKVSKLDAIIAICDSKIWNDLPDNKNNAHWASRPQRLKIINAELSVQGYEISKSSAGMEKLIQQALKRAGRRPKKKKREWRFSLIHIGEVAILSYQNALFHHIQVRGALFR